MKFFWNKNLKSGIKQTGGIKKKPWLFAIGLFAGFVLLVEITGFYRAFPTMAGIEYKQPVSSKILDRNGKLLYEIFGEAKRTLIPLDKNSEYLKQATVAAEDRNFYNHGALSYTSVLRAAYKDYQQGAVIQGGSTISQQVVKNILLNPNKSFARKFKEAALAFRLEHNFTKDQILEMYLNTVPYGRNAYGSEAAAQTYFGKHANELDLAESAYLAALPKAPSFYNPDGPNLKNLKQRQVYVLNQMEKAGYITFEQSIETQREKVAFKPLVNPISAPYFVKWVEKNLEAEYGKKALQEQGLIVYTTIDSDLQDQAEKIVEEGVKRNSKQYNAHNAALIAMDPQTGQILAMVGGEGYFDQAYPSNCKSGVNCKFDPKVNVAVAPRQPGSSFKPYTYVTAFSPEFGFAPASPILDVRQNFSIPGQKPYSPQDFDGGQRGLVSMRKALAGSLNIPAVRTLSMIGISNVTKTITDLGINMSTKNCGLSLALGACEIKLLDHVSGFSAFANGGKKVTPIYALKIVDKTGTVLQDNQNIFATEQVLNPEAVYELVDILSDNNARSYIFGSHSPLILDDRPVAAKTGTSQNFKDGWTVGFTPQLTVGVWTGNNDGSLIRAGGDGVVVAAPIWHNFMQAALKNKPVLAFNRPDGIEEVAISAKSGKLATEYTIDPVKEIFAHYSVPNSYDPYLPPPVELPTPVLASAAQLEPLTVFPETTYPIPTDGTVADPNFSQNSVQPATTQYPGGTTNQAPTAQQIPTTPPGQSQQTNSNTEPIPNQTTSNNSQAP